MDAVALAAREISDALLLVGPAEIERRDVRAGVARPGADLDVLRTLGDLLPDVLLRIERVARLRHVAELHRLAHHQRAAVRLLLAGNEAEQRRLPGSVRTDDPDDATARQREGEVVEQQAIAIALAELVRVDDDVAEPRSGRDADLELALAQLGLFRKEALVRLDACFALRLPRARRRPDPLELAREGSLSRRLLLLFVRQPLALLVQPRAVVALVRDTSALVELEDPAGGVVEEVAVVRHRDDAAVVAGERALQPRDRIGVEVVRRLVQQQQVRVRQKQPAERDATALAARERSHVLFGGRQPQRVHRMVDLAVEIPEPPRLDLVLRLLEVGVQLVHLVVRERLAELRRKLLVPLQHRPPVRDAFLDVAPHVLAGVKLRLLGEQAGAIALRNARVADVLLVDARHDAEERRLPRAVRAEHADLGGRVEGERDPLQDLALRPGHDLLEPVHRVDELWRHVRTVSAHEAIRCRPAPLRGVIARRLPQFPAVQGGLAEPLRAAVRARVRHVDLHRLGADRASYLAPDARDRAARSRARHTEGHARRRRRAEDDVRRGGADRGAAVRARDPGRRPRHRDLVDRRHPRIAARPLPLAARRGALRGDAVRGRRRAARLPVLRRARVQGALQRRAHPPGRERRDREHARYVPRIRGRAANADGLPRDAEA